MKNPGRVGADETARRVARFRAITKATGVKLTPQRLEIFYEVASSLEHPDAETVYRAIHAHMPTVSLDTVYRTLWMLSSMGLISTLGVRRERIRFDANTKNHHHFVCVRCGLIRDFAGAELRALRLPDSVRELGRALSTHIEVRGVCQSCARKNYRKDSQSALEPKGRKGRRL